MRFLWRRFLTWPVERDGRQPLQEEPRQPRRGGRESASLIQAGSTKLGIEAAITAGRKRAPLGSTGRRRRLGNKSGYGCVCPGLHFRRGTETDTLFPRYIFSALGWSGGCDPSLSHQPGGREKQLSPGGSRYSRSDWTEATHRGDAAARPRSHSLRRGDNGPIAFM